MQDFISKKMLYPFYQPRAFLAFMITAIFCSQFCWTAKNCYTCESSKSLEDCEIKQNLQYGCTIISNETSTCYISEATLKNGQGQYGKHCIAKDKCNEKSICNPEAVECTVTCCDEPTCNIKKGWGSAGLTKTTSSVVLVTFLLLTLLLINL